MNNNSIDLKSTSTDKYECIFSVVIAVYNCEPYLRETLDSIVNQNIQNMCYYENGVLTDKPISFEKLVEVIMVDDGSKDSSGAICDEYAEKYPNFKVIHKANGGVASARNAGLEAVRGKYMNFLDSDDKFSDNVLRKIYEFFELNYEKTDVVTMPLEFFDAFCGPHWQNYKFKKGARVVNLYNDYDCPLMFVNASFFKSEYKDKVKFNGKLVCGEDIRYICEILSEKMTMGLVPYCHYDYRRRSSGEESLVQTSKKKLGWYFDYFEHLTEWGINFCKNKWGYIPYYFQNILMCDLQWRFLGNYEITARTVLGEELYEEYKKRLFTVIKSFDDKIILEQKNIWNEHKNFILTKKYERSPDVCVYPDDVMLRFENTKFCWLSSCYTLITAAKIEDNYLTIEGYTTLLNYTENDSLEIFFEITDNEDTEPRKAACTIVDNLDLSFKALDETLYPTLSFIGKIDISNIKSASINLACLYNGNRIVKKDIRFGRFAPLSKKYKNECYVKNGYVLKLDKYTFKLTKHSRLKCAKHKVSFLKELLKSKKKSDKKAFFAITLAKINKIFNKKKIWLISDRESVADDNGEVLFEYLSENKPRNTEVYFVLDIDSADFERLSRIGKVLPLGSRKHKMKYLLSDVVFLSHTDDPLILPFKEFSSPYRGYISEKKYIFLQHGVTKDDVSRWFNKYTINATGFITSSVKEQESIIEGNYGYTESQVWLTGMPRFDRLYDAKKKIISVVPTWRSYLLSGNGTIPDDKKFLSSNYFEFYKNLFSNERLRNALDHYGYELMMKPHFRMAAYLKHFEGIEGFAVFPEQTDYRTVFAESALMLTDYSSTAFDFAYLRKPVLYTQFDKEEFSAGAHTYTPGYFEYERDGFGEVVYDLDSTIDKLIEYIENDCEMKAEYLERINGFYAFNDKDNCKRIVDKIIELS